MNKFAPLSSKSGQTSVEYILLLLVVMLITFSAMEQVRRFFLPEGDRCVGNDRALVCQFERIYNLDDLRYYRFPGQ